MNDEKCLDQLHQIYKKMTSVFEQIHTKRQNHLEHQRLNDLYRDGGFWVLDEEPISELVLENLEIEIYSKDVIPVAEEVNISCTKEPQNDDDVLDEVGDEYEIIGNDDIDVFGGEYFDEQGFTDITFDASNLGDDF
ncbi:hypothetical protein M5K25_012965 [Dendrobium thyrsiflorum]|uniref:Uncharacterized protein n=1 Tax=Dendrobium thyrsiflorum TaxID=117978 RepID=A0ABD0UYT4_DENTH